MKHISINHLLWSVAGIPLLIVLSCMCLSCLSDHQTVKKGESALRLGDHEGARLFFEAVLQHNPENFEARLGMGKALIQKASQEHSDSTLWSKALTHLEAARTLKPESGIDTLLAEAWLVNARRCIDNKDTVDALNALSRAIDLQPKGFEALNLAGIIYFRMGEVDKARILFKRALDADTLRPYTYFNLGMVQWAVGDVGGAHKVWFRALELAPQDKDIMYWYAVAEKKLQESEQ